MKGAEQEEQGSLLGATMANEMIGKRRLTIEQVRSLESNFETENKLEPERKMQLAKELGLRPRQVAVWFQNRRARWKTKQLERDFETLAADYERLKKDYDNILHEKTQLKADVQRACASSGTVDKSKLHCEIDSCNATSSLPTVDITQSIDGALSGSSSGVMDADSPRTTDHSSHCEDHLIESSTNLFLANDDPVVLETLTMAKPQEDRRLETLKLEDRRLGTDHDGFGDQSCDYLLLQVLDEPQSELPWWDWP